MGVPDAGARGDSDPLLVFLHIPKTGGTTLVTMLAQRYAPETIRKIMMRGMSLIVPPREKASGSLISASKIRRLKRALRDPERVRLIHGHFDLSLERLLPSRASLFTILRDPVERAISHYYHYRRQSNDPANGLAMRSTLAEWVSARGLVEMDNGQTRRLAGEMRLPVGRVSERMLEKAKENLASKFSVIGLTERFEESQVLLSRAFGWRYTRPAVRNVGTNRPARSGISEAELRLIRNCNCFDVELYRFAAELFARSAANVNMDTELSLLRSAQENIGSVRQDLRGAVLNVRRRASLVRELLSAGLFQHLRRRMGH
ncbi:MAG TPA: sulfotransferase family 2 domain-containing protein [Burkholderiales bacterium]|nr:sulfotransferase family 2 domain-containing protein [Burkholderiales bacterium]